MEKLIITCCTSDVTPWKDVHDLNLPVTAREIADSAHAARDAGAAIVHVNEPLATGAKDTMGYNFESWLEVSGLIRQGSDVIYEHGSSGLPYFEMEDRDPPVPAELRRQTFDIRAEKPEMIDLPISISVSHYFGQHYHLLPTRNDVARWFALCRENHVKPAIEDWQNGSLFGLRFWINEGLIDPPYWVTIYFGAYSGAWIPPTTEELLHRVNALSENMMWRASVFCGAKGTASTQQQLALLTQAITLGGHVRIGMEDNPYYRDDVPARSNAQLVEGIVRIARELGRDIATPAEARQMLGMPERSR